MPLTHHTVTPNQAGIELAQYLSEQLKISRRQAKALLDCRNVLVNQRPVWMARHRLKPGDRIALETTRPGHIILESRHVLLDNNGYLVVNKPPGITTNGKSSLETALREFLGSRSIQAVHRLDRNTSGCVIFSRNSKAHARLVEFFRAQGITKTYRTLVDGEVKQGDIEIRRRIDSRQAFTRARLLRSGTLASHLSVQIVTGRTHQIRKHLASIKHAVVGDREYGKMREYPGYGMPPRQMLHAYALRFNCPVSGQGIRIEAPLPKDFKECLRALV
jgi:23S rRNA pseudouridine1911/1915/1917 synthase